jgi:hypothetical protein
MNKEEIKFEDLNFVEVCSDNYIIKYTKDSIDYFFTAIMTNNTMSISKVDNKTSDDILDAIVKCFSNIGKSKNIVTIYK